MTGDARPVLVYDGACGLCRRAVERFARLPARFRAVAFQTIDGDPRARELARRHGLATDDFARAMFLLDDAAAFRGHRAFDELLRRSGGPLRLLARVSAFAPFAWIDGRVYGAVAANRATVSRLLRITPSDPSIEKGTSRP